MMSNASKANAGFTLVELAISLVIIGFLLGATILPLLTMQERALFSESRRQLDEIREALLGYGLSHGHLPCPAISNVNGAENRNAGTGRCNSRIGFLPWAELGYPKLDSWGHLYRYSVSDNYSRSDIMILLGSLGDITVTARDINGAVSNIQNIPAVVLSHGSSASWAFQDNGVQIADTSATNIDEDVNGNGVGTNFVVRDINRSPALLGGEFDDLTIWIPANLYINRMLSAGQPIQP